MSTKNKEKTSKTHDSDEGNEKSPTSAKDRDTKNGEQNQESDGSGDDTIKVARTSTNPALLTQLEHRKFYRQASSLGAGGTGATTWYAQRITALALIPLTVWFAVSVVRMSMASQAAAAQWLAHPVNAVVMAVFIVIALRHASIGLTIILEDYVPSEGLRAVAVLLVKAAALVLSVASIAALIHLAV